MGRVIQTNFGQKGGTGPTAGLKAARYRVTTPDGRGHIKRSFNAILPVSNCYVYQHEDVWYVGGIYDEKPDWSGVPGYYGEARVFVDAERIG